MSSGISTYADRIIASQADSQILVGSTTVGTAGSLCISATNITQYDTDGSYVEWSTNGIQSVSSTFDISGNITFAGTGNTSTSNGWVLMSNGVGAPTFQEFTSYADLDQVCNSMMSEKPNYTTQSLNVVDNISTPTYQTAIYDYKIDISQNAGGYQNQAIVTTAVNSTSSGLYFNSSTAGAQVGQITLDTLNYLMMEGANTSTAVQFNPTDLSMSANTSTYSNNIVLSSSASVNNSPQLLLTSINFSDSETYTLSINTSSGDFITASDQVNHTKIGSHYLKITAGSTEIASITSDGTNSTLDLSGSNPNIKIHGNSGTTGQVITYNGTSIAWQNAPFYYYVDLTGAPANNGTIAWTTINSYLTSLTNIPLVIMTADSGNASVCIPMSSAGSTTTDLHWAAASNIISLSILVYSRG
jgi:hypothetical protein